MSRERARAREMSFVCRCVGVDYAAAATALLTGTGSTAALAGTRPLQLTSSSTLVAFLFLSTAGVRANGLVRRGGWLLLFAARAATWLWYSIALRCLRFVTRSGKAARRASRFCGGRCAEGECANSRRAEIV